MVERIIPITIERDEEPQSSQDSVRSIPIQIENNEEPQNSQEILSKSVEQLSVNNGAKGTKTQSQASKNSVNDEEVDSEVEEILKEFDNFVEHSNLNLPNASAREKIVLVVDRAQDEIFTPFIVKNTKYTPLSMIKRAIHIFIKLKLMIQKEHEIAIVVLNESTASIHLNFTSDLRKLRDSINKITKCQTEDIFDLNSLFTVLHELDNLPDNHQTVTPPPYVVRCILFYGRSYTMPNVKLDETARDWLEHPYFTCDVLMTHEPVESSNHCDKIFNVLQNMDKKGLAYFFPVCRNVKRLHNCTSKLLAHPLQRPIQKILKK